MYFKEAPDELRLGSDDGPLVPVRNSATSLGQAAPCRTIVSFVPLRAAWIVLNLILRSCSAIHISC